MSGRSLRHGAAVGLAVLGTLSCVSERPEPTAASEIDCSLALDEGTLGSIGTVVAIRDFAFVPGEIRVPRGARVTWVNCEKKGVAPHTSTADAWGSALLRPGQSFSHTFEQRGSFDYHCAPHPFMKARIVVE